MVGSGGPVLSSNGIVADLQFVGRAHVRGPNNTVKQMLLTVSFLGLQIVWSTEMAYASPYLLSLGLSKAGMSAVFLAGPLSGLIVQPIIGAIADRSTSRFGRRRPVIVIGCILTVISLLVFGYTREVASIFTRWGSNAHTNFTIFLAVLAVYALDFAINGIMAVNRALIVDVLPVSQQEEALAWGTRMVAVGSILGFWVGNVDLVPTFGFLGSEQIKILSIFASLSLAVTHAITVFTVEERVLLPSADELQEQLNLPGDTDHPARALIARIQFWRRWQSNPILDSVKHIWHTYRTLPEPIWDICKVQAFAWGGWFPMLFFSSTYVAEIYAVTHVADRLPFSNDTGSRDTDPGTRAGSRALFLQSIVSFVASIVIPFCVVSGVSTASNGRRHRLVDEQGTTYALSWSGSSNLLVERLLRYMPTLPFQWLDLTRLWMISHIGFAVLMFGTWFVGAVWSATTLLTVLGLCWTVTMWAPGSLLATEILQASGDGRRGAKSTSYSAVDTVNDSVEQFALQPTHGLVNAMNNHSKLGINIDKANGGLGIVGMPNIQPATPLRTYFSAVDEHGNAAHPPPLDVQHNLSSSHLHLNGEKGYFDAGKSSPFADVAISTPTSPSSATRNRTLQLRHSPSRSSISSSEDDYDTSSSSYMTPVPESQLINPFDRMLRSHSSLSGTQSGENTPRRRASPMPPALSRQSSGMRPSLETVRPSPAVLRDADLSTEESDLAREQNYLTGGGETRTADQAGAIMGIANIFVVLPQFMTSFISSIVFALFGEPAAASIPNSPSDAIPDLLRRYTVPRSALASHAGSNDSIGFVFRIGGVSALVAAWFCWQMRKRKQRAVHAGNL